jgi:serine/threonine protein kinase/tetratricopeptide (TPR) repeat protein
MSSKQNMPQLKPGDVVAGRFRIVEPIGSGGFSVVYRAHQEAMNRFVALKVLKPTASNDEKIVERFRREALFASHLSHPNTITLFDYGHTDAGLCYIAMELLHGTDLADVVQNGQPMDLKRVWNILHQCCHSLAEAHRLGLVHRDLKPENIFLVQRDGDEFIKVLDFGVSKAISNFANAGPRTMAPLTQEGTVFGTPLYMAPEQAMAEAITPSADVYALGHIAYEMITGFAAYGDCTNAMDVMLKQINDPPLMLPDPWSQTPFSPLITKCTAKEPEDRIENASRLLEHLLHDAFIPYMNEKSRPSRTRSLPRVPTSEASSASYTIPGESVQDVEEVYRWELDVLEEALAETKSTDAMRLVLVRGTPGTGRSNLVRAFLKKHRQDADLVISDRHSHADNEERNAGLEADLACVTEAGLEGRGVPEIRRVLQQHYDAVPVGSSAAFGDQGAKPGSDGKMDSDSAPISALGAERDSFLSRIAGPFREASRRGALIWSIENLEKVDTLTLAFLEHFFRDLQNNPAPILIVATVYPDDLMRRPGLLRYTQELLQATQPVARQLSLVAPGERKQGDTSTGEPTPPPDYPTEDANAGSYVGEEIPTMPSDGYLGEESQPQSVELFDELEKPKTDEPKERDEADIAFDTVLGFLAELGDEVPDDLWKLARARVLPSKFMALADFIVDQAERFGIIQRRDEALVFSQSGFADDLRESFDELVDPVPTHLELAALLIDFYESPDRGQLHTIIGHLRDAQAPYEAMELLRQAGEDAYRALDLDSAREYYLQIRQLIEDLETGRVIAGQFTGDQLTGDQLTGDQLTGDQFTGDQLSDEDAESNFEKAQVWVRLGEIHGAMGEHGAAEDAVSQALDPDAEASPALRGRAYKILADLAVSQERFENAKTHYRHARDSFREAGHPGAFVAAMGAMGHCALMEGKPNEAEEILSLALERADRLKNNVLGARLSRFMAQVLVRQGRFDEAVDHLGDALATFQQIRSYKEVAETLAELGKASFAAGEHAASSDHYRKALTMAASHHVALSESAHLGLGRALSALGDLGEATAHLERALQEIAVGADRLQEARIRFHIGDVDLAASRFDLADDHFQKVEETAKAIGHTELWLEASIRRAYVSFDSGDSGAAYEKLSETMQLAESLGDAGGELRVRAHVIYLQLLEHDFRTSGATFASLVDRSKELDLTRARVLCQLFKSDVHAAHGELEQAKELLEEARLGAAELRDFALLVPITRRVKVLAKSSGQTVDVGFAIGALVPPEVGKRRFGAGRLGA